MQNQFFDLYRNGIKTATEVAKVSLESTVQLQERQLGILRNVLEENRRSADALTEAKSLEELMSAQTRIVRSQLERSAELWSSFVQAAAEQQKTWIERMQQQLGQTGERMREGYEFASRTTEDIARTAANQVSRATGSVREAASAAQERSRKSA